MPQIDLKIRLERRERLRKVGLKQRRLAERFKCFPQQVHDACNGLQPSLWVKIEKILIKAEKKRDGQK